MMEMKKKYAECGDFRYLKVIGNICGAVSRVRDLQLTTISVNSSKLVKQINLHSQLNYKHIAI